VADEAPVTPLPTPILLEGDALLPTPTLSIRTIATDLAQRAQEPLGGVPTLVGTLQPQDPIVVYHIVTATPAPVYSAPAYDPLPTATQRPRPLPRPANPVYPVAPVVERTPPPPPTPPSRNPLDSPLAIITAAP
jgi:hypothetical protein